MHWEEWFIALGVDLEVNVIDALVLLGASQKRCGWFWIAAIWMLRFSAAIPVLYGAEHQNAWLTLLANAVFLWLGIFGRGGPGKKLWGKIRSAALTAVNQATFQRQTREVLS